MESSRKKELVIFIPTMNRAECIKKLLDDTYKVRKEYSIDCFIYDTSKSDDTKRVVEEQLDETVQYYREENYPDKTTDLKVIQAFEWLSQKYNYVWLSGDGCILKIEELYSIIRKCMNENMDVIHFTNNEAQTKDNVLDIYSNPIKFFHDNAYWATFYSATILSSKLIKEVNWKKIGEEYRNTGFLYWKGLFEAIADGKKKMAVINKVYFETNPYKVVNSSYSPGKFLRFWVGNWPKVVDSLPKCYDEHKEKIQKSFDEKQHLYGIRNLVRLRLCDNLDINYFKMYKNNFKKVTNGSIMKIFIISCIPVPIIKVCVKSIKIMRNILRRK